MANNSIASSSNAMQSFQACNSSLGFSNSSLGPSELYSFPPEFENREIRISHDIHTAIALLPALGHQLRFCDEQQRLNSLEKCTLAFEPLPDPMYKSSNFVRDFLQLIRELLTNAPAADGGKEKCRFYGSSADDVDDGGKKKEGFHGSADDDGDEGFHGRTDDDGGEKKKGFHGSNPESDDYYNGSGAADDDDGKDKYGFHGSNPESDDYYNGNGSGAAAASDDDDGKDKCIFLGSDEDPRLILTRCINAWDKRKLKPFWLGFLMLFVYLLHRIADQKRALIFPGLGFFCGFCDNHVVMLYNYHEIITVTVMAVVILSLWFVWLFVGSISSFFVSLLILLLICICMDNNTWPNNRY